MVTSGRASPYGDLCGARTRSPTSCIEAGLRRGDGIVLMLPICIEFYELAWGAQRSGLYYTPVNTHLTADEIAYIIDDSGAKAVFIHASASAVPPRNSQRPQGAVAGVPPLCRRWRLAGYDHFDQAMRAGHPTAIPPNLRKVPRCSIPPVPRGVRRGYAALVARPGSRVVRAIRYGSGLRPLSHGRDSVYLSPAPLYQRAPLAYTMAVLRMGATACSWSVSPGGSPSAD